MIFQRFQRLITSGVWFCLGLAGALWVQVPDTQLPPPRLAINAECQATLVQSRSSEEVATHRTLHASSKASSKVGSIAANSIATATELRASGAPRLFLTPARLQQIRCAIQTSDHHNQAFNAMKTRVEQNRWQVYDQAADDGNWNYARSWLAREAALLYQVTGETAYAQIAYDHLRAIYDDPDPDNRLPESGYGLSRAMVGMGFAITYDWAAWGWTAEQRMWVRSKIRDSLDGWIDYTHSNLAAPWGSNWVAVCRGAELVMMLAVEEELDRSSRFELIKSQLKQHIRTAYSASGFTQEGNGYLSYSGGFLLPAVYALRSVGDASLEADFDAKAFWKLALYAGAFGADQRSLQFGVGGAGFEPEGWTSLLFGAVPDRQLPYYQFFYDRHRGIHNPAPALQKFDHARAGTTWALIYYPFTAAIAPDSSFPPVFADELRGAYFFRNRWQNANDTLVSLMGDFSWHPKAWDQSEALTIGLIANGTRFIGGSGKARDARYFSHLLVDGKTGMQKTTGKQALFEATDRGGYVIVDGGDTYSSLGIDSVKRHLQVEFDPDGTTLLSTLDRIRDQTAHAYTWQINIGDVQENQDIRISTGQESGLSTFLLRDENDNFVKGWVIHPNAVVTAGDPLRVTFSGANADIWVTMWVGQGMPPVATRTGTGENTILTIDETQIRYDSVSDRIIVNQ
jgi:hypothetical protein